METMETDTREGVTSRGHPHTEQSRMKISQANKGKTPWNIGKKHSEETKRKIAVKTREAYLRRKEAEKTRLQTEEPEKWAAMLAEQEAAATRAERVKEEKAAAEVAKKAKVCCCRRRCTRPSRRRPSRHRPCLHRPASHRFARHRPSHHLPARYHPDRHRGGYQVPNDCACVPQAEAAAAAKVVRAAERAANLALPEKDRSSIYSQEVRDKISEGLRKRWRDPEYRASRNYTTSNETRLKLSKAMKAKWQDGAFRKRNTVNGTHHSPERRAKIAESVKRKWALDGDYRNRTVEAIRRSRATTIKRREQDPEAYAAWKSKISESMKARWAEDGFRADRLSAFAEAQPKRAITRSINRLSERPAAPRKPRATAAETAAKRKESSAAKRRRLDIATRKREEATAVRQNAKSNAGFEDRLRAAMGVGAPWSPPGSGGAAAPKPAAAPAPAPAAVTEEEEEEEEESGEELASPEAPHPEDLALEEDEEGGEGVDEVINAAPPAVARGRGRPAGSVNGRGGGGGGGGISGGARGSNIVSWGDFELELGSVNLSPVEHRSHVPCKCHAQATHIPRT